MCHPALELYVLKGTVGGAGESSLAFLVLV